MRRHEPVCVDISKGGGAAPHMPLLERRAAEVCENLPAAARQLRTLDFVIFIFDDEALGFMARDAAYLVLVDMKVDAYVRDQLLQPAGGFAWWVCIFDRHGGIATTRMRPMQMAGAA